MLIFNLHFISYFDVISCTTPIRHLSNRKTVVYRNFHNYNQTVKMVVKHRVEGFEHFKTFIKELDDGKKPIFIYFGGSKLPSGESWCEDCVRAAPIIESSLQEANEDFHFVYVDVGDREFWKDLNCPFRKDAKTKLMVLPTVLKWNSHRRLEGDQCEKLDLLLLLFGDED